MSVSVSLRKQKNGKYEVYRVFSDGTEDLIVENRTLAYACRFMRDEIDFISQNVVRGNYEFR